MIDLGDIVPLSVQITDATGVLADATTVVLTVTLPDDSTATPAVAKTSTGVYAATYTPLVAGRFVARWVATGTNAGAFTDVFVVTESGAGGVLSLAEAKKHLNITASDSDAELRDFIEVAVAAAESVSGRVLAPRAVVETTEGTGSGWLVLGTSPAFAVTSVVESGVTVSAANYRLTAGGQILERVTGSWSTTTAGLVVTYRAGATGSDLAIVKHAVKEMLRHLWITQRGGGRAARDGEAMIGAGYSFPNRVLQLLGLDRPGGFA